MRYIAEKGSISINGVSLTVNSITKKTFKINLIPFTLENTALKHISVSGEVNIEIDMLARYVETIFKKP